jgi:hypothetical protein
MQGDPQRKKMEEKGTLNLQGWWGSAVGIDEVVLLVMAPVVAGVKVVYAIAKVVSTEGWPGWASQNMERKRAKQGALTTCGNPVALAWATCGEW